MAVKIDTENCTGCGTCAMVCPSDVIRMDKETNKAVAVYNRDCVSCRLCEVCCPFETVAVVAGKMLRKGAESGPMRLYLAGLKVDTDVYNDSDAGRRRG